MSLQTVKLYATDSAYVASNDASKSFQTGEMLSEHISAFDNKPSGEVYKYGLLQFADDSAVTAKRIRKVSIGLFLTEASNPEHTQLDVGVLAQGLPKTLANANYYTVAGIKFDSLLLKPIRYNFLVNQYNYAEFKVWSTLNNALYQAVARGVTLSPTKWTSASNRIVIATAHNAPYLLVDCETVAPITSWLHPDENQLIDKNRTMTFQWDVSTEYEEEVYSPWKIKIKSAKLRYRKTNQSDHVEINIIGEANQYGIMEYSFPANTFELADYEWRVSVTSEDNLTSQFSEWARFTTVDSLSSAQVISPKGAYLEGNKPNTFAWKHIIPTGTLQNGAELQTSANGSDWRPLKTVAGAVQQTDIPANTLLGDTHFWRVHTKNYNGVAGSWSEAAPIVVYAAPRPPSVTPPEGAPRITVSWQSVEQQAFEVSADSWKSGTIYGTAKIYPLPQWFSDGPVTVGVRVQSSLGLWSDWATVRVTVVNQPQGAVVLSARSVPNGVRLYWTGSHAAYTIYRDGVPILSTTAAECTDWLTTGRHQYQVRGINGRFYSLSNEVYEYSTSRWSVISPVDTIDWLNLRFRRGSSAETTAGTSRQMALQYLAGRTKPVAEVSEQLTVEHSFEYGFSDPRDLERLRTMVGQTVVCKGKEGPAVIGILTAVNDTSDWAGADISFTITETDYKEGGGLENH